MTATLDGAEAIAHVEIGNPPQLNIGDATIGEGDSGTKLLTFTVTMSHSSSHTITVHYHTSDGTSTITEENATTADDDYESATGTLTFAPGVTTQTLTVTINGDHNQNTDPEENENFTVTLTDASVYACIEDADGVGKILNDDPDARGEGPGRHRTSISQRGGRTLPTISTEPFSEFAATNLLG